MSLIAVRVLLVEDDAVDRLACRRVLRAETEYAFDVAEADTARAGLQQVRAGAPDLILLDYHLPDIDGLEFLAELAADTGEVTVPVIMLTGAQDIAVAVDAMRRGARDFLVKDVEGNYLKLLPAVVHRVLRESRALAEKRETEAKYRSLIEQIPAIAYTAALDVPGKLLYVGPQIARLGYTPEEWCASPDGVLNRIHPDDLPRVLEAFARSYESAAPLRCEYRLLTREGRPRWFLDEARVVLGAAGEPLCLQGVLIDIDEDKEREAELEYHRRHLEELVAHRTAQIEKQTELLRDANANLLREIGERRRAEAAVRDSEALATSELTAMTNLHGLVTRLLACSDLSAALEEILGAAISLTGAAMGNMQLFDQRQNALVIATQRGFKQDFLEYFRAVRIDDNSACSRAMASGERIVIEDVQTDPSFEPHRRIAASAGYRAVQSTPLMGRSGELLGMLSTHYPMPHRPSDRDLRVLDLYARQAADFIERKQAEEALRATEARFRQLLESAGEGIYGLDTEGRCIFVNEAALTMLGYAREELLGREMHGLVHHTHADGSPYPAQECRIYDAFRRGQSTHGLVEVLWRKDGSSFPAEYSAQPMRQAGEVTGAVLVFRDVTEAQALARRLSFQATHDALTGLVNRQEFERRLERVLTEKCGDGEEHALLYVDLDQFKVVNDTCGHTAGDQLLRQVTAQLHERLRGRDTLARLGGDEFGVLLEHCPLDQALRIATELRDAVQDYRFVWEGKPFSVGASIGLVPLTSVSGGVAAALAAADAACYAAKEQGRNRVHLYQPDDALLQQQHAQMQWVSRLTHALDANRFRLYQQGIAPLGGQGRGRPHYEILLRLLDEEGRVVEPMAFVPAAERYNLMPAIDRWVVREVISRHAAQQRDVPAERRPIFAVNLSGSSLTDERLAEFVRGLLAEYRVPADMLCFEITETAAIANLGRAAQFIQTLKREGCLFALDDFGSGMSSFAYLKQLPVDFLKIDGSFIRTMAEDRVTRAMAEAINRVAHVMAFETVAECAESAPILALLQELGVDHAQGYALARPQPMAAEESADPGAGPAGAAREAKQ